MPARRSAVPGARDLVLFYLWVVVVSSTAFIVLVLVLMFRPTGLLGESLGKARA